MANKTESGTTLPNQAPSLASGGECWCFGDGSRPVTREAGHDGTRVDTFIHKSGLPVTDSERVFSADAKSFYLYCRCSVGEEKLAVDRQRARDREEKTRLNWLNHIKDLKFKAEMECRIPARFMDLSLDSSPLAGTYPDLIDRLKKSVGSRQSFLLHGGYGVGKTGLAAAFAKLHLHLDKPEVLPRSIYFTTVADLLSELRSTYNRRGDDEASEAELLDLYQYAELVVLDDLGAEHAKDLDWLRDRLFQLIGSRHAEGKALFVTTNLDMEQLGQRYGERITWRLLEMCGEDNIVQIRGANLRDWRQPHA